MTSDTEVSEAAERLFSLLQMHGLTLACAESCTGGLVSAAVTAIPGSSAVLERGFVTYSDQAKQEMLGVPAGLISDHGAVSEAVARAMAAGALDRSHADIGVSITGIAGPGGGLQHKPVGLVHFAVASRTGAALHRERRFGDLGRAEIRRLSVLEAIDLVGEIQRVG